MPGFTEEEIDASVNQFLLSELTVTTLQSGSRDVTKARDTVYDLLGIALLLRPDSYYYVIYLAKNRLRGLIDLQIADLDAIATAGPHTTRPSKRIESTAELTNAQAAILELGSGMNARTEGVRGSIGPAVDRFRRSVSRFVSTELTKNVMVGGQVTETGPELRSKIQALWSSVTERHFQIQELAEGISDAINSFGRIRLPQSAVGKIVNRINTKLTGLQETLGGTQGIQQSRSAMLDLLTMRSLLTKASSFRNPDLVLMPKAGDGTTVSLIDSDGIQASVTGDVSGPFNYGPAASLTIDINGGAVTYNIPLPRQSMGSRAELRSQVLAFPDFPSTPAEVRFNVEFGVLSPGAPYSLSGGPWASGTAAAAELDTVSPAVDVSWDSTNNQLVFQSVSDGDDVLLYPLFVDSAHQRFVEWAFGAPPQEAVSTPVSAQDVAAAIRLAAPEIDVEVLATTLASFSGAISGTTVEHSLAAGADLASDGTTLLTSPTVNFENAGVLPGMGVEITAPAPQQVTVVSVSGRTLVVSAPVPAATLTYYIGPDYGAVTAGARVRVTAFTNRYNSGHYRVVSSGIGRITLDRSVAEAEDDVMISVFTEYLKLSARGTTTSSSIEVQASAAATALGLPTAVETASLTSFQLSSGDFLLRGVRTGDLVDLVSPSSSLSTNTLAAVESSLITVTDPVAYEAGNWSYSIRSLRAAQFEPLRIAASNYLSTAYVANFPALDRLIARLINGSQYSSDISGGIQSYRSALVSLLAAVTTYFVPVEAPIDGAIRTMQEQGFDRALDLLLTLRIEELFTMHPDGVSYATWVVRNAATVAREVVPATKFAVTDAVVQDTRMISQQTDSFDPLGQGRPLPQDE